MAVLLLGGFPGMLSCGPSEGAGVVASSVSADEPGGSGGTGGSSGPGVSGGSAEDGNEDGNEDGRVATGADLSPFDTEHPAVSRLDPALREAVRRAARDARKDGVEFFVTSGWRSTAYQQRLLEEGVRKYGSREEARKFVSSPEDSAHVTGEAVDIGPTDADDWLIRKGAAYGLCQVYANEMWHFELLTEPGGDCPPLRTDAAG